MTDQDCESAIITVPTAINNQVYTAGAAAIGPLSWLDFTWTPTYCVLTADYELSPTRTGLSFAIGVDILSKTLTI